MYYIRRRRIIPPAPIVQGFLWIEIQSIVINDRIFSDGLRVLSFSTTTALTYLSKSSTIHANVTIMDTGKDTSNKNFEIVNFLYIPKNHIITFTKNTLKINSDPSCIKFL